MRDFKDLKVWHKAHGFVIDVYQQSRSFPADERFGLTAHLRKSATSFPPTSPKAVAARAKRSSPGFAASQPALRASSSTSCSWRTTSRGCLARIATAY